MSENKLETMDKPGQAAADDPIALFRAWLDEATRKEPANPTAAALATTDQTGMPNVRMILLKTVDEQGFVFFTNLESRKGVELLANPKAALCFHWKSTDKQIRIQGNVTQVSDTQADQYFASRDKGSKIGAWASRQSRELESRFALEKQAAKYTARFALSEVPRPPYWSGFRLSPVTIEFWSQRAFRLHERMLFSRKAADRPWQVAQLYP